MDLSYDDRRDLSRLKAEENLEDVAAALEGKHAAYEEVVASPELSAVFGPAINHEQRLVILKDTAAEGKGCRITLTQFGDTLAVIKEIRNADTFRTELLRHHKASDLVKTELFCYSMRQQLIVTELGPRRDLLKELWRMVRSDMPPSAIGKTVVRWVRDLLMLLKRMSKDGYAHVDLKWENVSLVARDDNSDELCLALIDLASSMKHGGRLTLVDIEQVAATTNHCTPELLQEELYPTNDMHAVGHMIQMLILGPSVCFRLYMTTLDLDSALLDALVYGDPLQTAWAKRCGLRPNVVALLVLLQAVLVAPPARQPSWAFVEDVSKRLMWMVDKMEEPGTKLPHILTATELELQLLLLLSSTDKHGVTVATGPKACLIPAVLGHVRERYRATWQRYAHLKEADEMVADVWQDEVWTLPSQYKKANMVLIDADDEGAMDAHFAPLPVPFEFTADEYYQRADDAYELTSRFLPRNGISLRANLHLLDPDASDDPVMQRLSYAQQCLDGWGGQDCAALQCYLKELGASCTTCPGATSSGGSGSGSGGCATSSQGVDAVTLGLSRLEINAMQRGGHALRAAPRRKDAAAPPGPAAQRGAAMQRGSQRQLERQAPAVAAAEGKQGGAGGEAADENVDSNAAGGMPPPPPRAPAARQRAAGPAEQQAAAGKSRAGAEEEEEEGVECAAGSSKAQQVKDWMMQMLTVDTLPTLAASKGVRNRPPQGTELWQCGNKKGHEWCKDEDDLNRMLQLGGSWRTESRVLTSVLHGYCKLTPVQEALAAAKARALEGKGKDKPPAGFIVLLPLQLTGGMLPPALETELVQAGLLVEKDGGLGMVTSPLPFTIVFACSPSSRGLTVQRSWTNEGLRKGLGLLCVRPAASEDDEGCGPVASRDGQRYVLTQLGASLWHHIMRHLLSSKAAATQIPAYFTTREPPELGTTDEWEKNGATRLNAP